jgi:S-adenosylmethionine:tRNA ribosyltransferase-isomerase
MNFEELLAQYDYPLSPEMIAATPADPRDSSRLLVYQRSANSTHENTFAHLANHLPKGALLVFNDTRVIPARIPGYLPTGGKVELLCTSFEGQQITALCERRLPSGERITLSDEAYVIVGEKKESEYLLTLFGAPDIKPLLQKLGSTPLPPYLKNSPLSEEQRREKYQTVFAKYDGSIAAPTASLHFTPDVFTSLTNAGIEKTYVTLHVNLGTFMPFTEESLETGQLHEEHFKLSDESRTRIERTKKEGRPVIAVGTTALRAIESAFAGEQKSTRLFIREGYEFKVIDGLITNFHVPKSSLMMLVAALIGREKLLELYAYAAKNNFRFFSFGDAMLVL